jgi:two-component system sensor histidine kinase AgrC
MKLTNTKLNNLQKLKVLFLTIILVTITNFIFPKVIKLLLNFAFLILINYFTVSKKLKQSIFAVIISQTILWISEFSFVIIMSIFYKGNIQGIIQLPLVYVLMNFYITIISFSILKTKWPIKLFNILNSFSSFSQTSEPIIYSIIIICIIIISTAESHMKLPTTIVLITNVIIGIIFIAIIFISSKTEVKYNQINGKYETSINSLREYEAMIDKFRVNNHENKNQLLTVRNMIKDNPDKAIEYIDTLVNHKFKDNEAIMYRTSKIPEGGLRATIYSKLCIMDKEKIKYTLDIANDVRTAELINIDDDLTLDICKILGVFLDNAIEAVKSLRKRQIDIEMYIMDGKLCIDITNNFKGNFDLEKIGSKKYSTKGANHGYGLSLVSQIIKEHSNVLENEKSINKNTFTQCLKIKM